MATDTSAVIKELEDQMATAVIEALGEEARELVQSFRIQFSDCSPRILLAMAIFLGEEIAASGRIRPKNRQECIEAVVTLIHLVYEARGR